MGFEKKRTKSAECRLSNCKKDDYKGVAQNFVGSPSQSGSLVIRDDMILMEIRKDLKEKFEQERINRTEAMTESKKLDRAIPQDIIIS